MMNPKATLFVICLLAFTSCLEAENPIDRHPAARTPSSEYFWVVETGSTEGANYTIVRFYDGNKRLLDSRRVEGVRLNACRRSVQRKLNKALAKFVIFGQPGQKL